jgi:DNA-binding beta-propeller fold protein YncE
LRAWSTIVLAAGLAAGCTRSSPDRIFVSQAGSETVAVLDAGSGAVERRIVVGLLPHDLLLAADGRSLYAAVVGSQAIAEIDTASGTLRRTFLTAPVPSLRSDGSIIQAHLDGGALSGHTTCFDCHTGAPGGALPKYAGDRPFGMLLSADGTRLLVSHLRSSDIAVIDLASGAIERTVHLAPAGAATEAVALARVGGEVWVVLRAPQPSTEPGAVRRLAADTLEALGEGATGSDPSALLALPGRGTALVSDFESDTVTEWGADGPVRALVAAPGPLGLLPLPGGSRVLALDYYFNALSFLDLDRGTSETLPLQGPGGTYLNPTHAALSSDGRSAWLVSSGTEGHLLQLDLGSRRIVRDLPIEGLSFGVALVPGGP